MRVVVLAPMIRRRLTQPHGSLWFPVPDRTDCWRHAVSVRTRRRRRNRVTARHTLRSYRPTAHLGRPRKACSDRSGNATLSAACLAGRRTRHRRTPHPPRVLIDVKAVRSSADPLRGSAGLDAGSAHPNPTLLPRPQTMRTASLAISEPVAHPRGHLSRVEGVVAAKDP